MELVTEQSWERIFREKANGMGAMVTHFRGGRGHRGLLSRFGSEVKDASCGACRVSPAMSSLNLIFTPKGSHKNLHPGIESMAHTLK